MFNRTHFSFPVLLFFVSSFVFGEMVYEEVEYSDGENAFVGTLVYDGDSVKEAASQGESLVGILMVPNWMGPGAAAKEKAALIADDEFIVFVADVYGKTVRPTNSREASQAAGGLRGGDRQLLRDRMALSLQVFREQQSSLPLQPDHMIAIGFCLGGCSVLELARAGSDIPEVVSFHGNLDTPRPAETGMLAAKVLVLHGADDPYVPPEQVTDFFSEMQAAGVEDWQLIAFGQTVHSFTNPAANSSGARYQPVSAARAYEYMDELIEEMFETDDN